MRPNTDSRDRQRDLPTVAPLNLRRLRSFRSRNNNPTGQTPTSATTPVGENITSPLSAGGAQRYYHHGPSASVSATNLTSNYSPLAAHPAARLRNHSVSAATPRGFHSGRPTAHPHPHLQHQQHRLFQSVDYGSTSSANTQKRYDETRDPKFFEGGLFINGLAAHPTFAPASEKPSVSTPRANLVLSPGAKSRVQLQPALRSPGGHFYSYDQQQQREPEKQLILQSPPVLSIPSRPTQATAPHQISPSKRSPSRAPYRNVELDINAATSWCDESSLYSQPSPPDSSKSHKDFKPRNKGLAPAFQVVASAKMSQTYDISPPSSPDLVHPSHGEGKGPRNVSPFDSSDDATSSQKTKTEPSYREHSNIPAMRRERKNQALRAASSRDQMNFVKPDESSRQVFRVAQGQGMRWDAMTGEPTLGPGRSAQVKPAEYAQGISKSPNTEEAGGVKPDASRLRSPQGAFDDRLKGMRSVSQPTPAQAQSRIPQMSPHAQSPPSRMQHELVSPTELPEPQPRPEWKGGSGRTAIVAPVRDTKTGVKARRNPSVSSSRIASPIASETGRAVPVIRRMAPSKNKDKGRVTPVSSPTSKTSHEDGALASPGAEQVSSNYPTPPSSVDRKTSHIKTQPQYSSAQQHDVQHYSSQAQLQMQMQTQAQAQAQQIPSQHMASSSSIVRKPMPSTAGISTSNSAVSASAARDRSSSMTAWPHRVTDSVDQPLPSLVIPSAPSAASAVSAAAPISAVRSPVESIPESPFYEPVRPPSWVNPPSRFSVTTVGTSDYSLSPELNAVPEDDSIPPIPEDLSEPAYVRSPEPGSDSILSRPRPKFDNESGRGADMPIKISLGSWRPGMSRDAAKPVTTPSSSLAPAANSRLTRQPSSGSVKSFNSTAGSLFNSDTISMHTSSPGVKALPPAPPESSASDRVAHLNALLSALANRRININRSISKMMEMMPRDNLMARPEVLRKREQEKIKVQALRDELAEVQREEYELGIKLHRAYKRQAREGDYDNGTALWVRRAMN